MIKSIVIVVLTLILSIILWATVQTISNYRDNKKTRALIAEQLDKLRQLSHQPLSNELTKQFFDSQLKSGHSVSTECQLLKLILQNQTGFYGAL